MIFERFRYQTQVQRIQTAFSRIPFFKPNQYFIFITMIRSNYKLPKFKVQNYLIHTLLNVRLEIFVSTD